jgi:hypothetical protein
MSGSGDRRPAAGDRLLEVLAVVLLGIATLGSAWCGYQAAQWNDQENEYARDAALARVEATRLFGLATQAASYDANTLAQYAQAVSDENERLAGFLRNTLMRTELIPLVDTWEAQISAGQTPTNLLEDEDYLESQFGPYRAADAASAEADAAADEAGENSQAYVLTTVTLATALFFAGVTSSFRFRFARILLLMGASLTIAYGAARLIDLPTL